MVELADVLRVAGRMLSSHHRPTQDIVDCCTPALCGSLYRCYACGALEYRYHSYRNRHRDYGERLHGGDRFVEPRTVDPPLVRRPVHAPR